MKIVGTALLFALLAPFQAVAQTLTADTLLDRITGQTFEIRRIAMQMEITFQPDGSIAGRGLGWRLVLRRELPAPVKCNDEQRKQ